MPAILGSYYTTNELQFCGRKQGMCGLNQLSRVPVSISTSGKHSNLRKDVFLWHNSENCVRIQ